MAAGTISPMLAENESWCETKDARASRTVSFGVPDLQLGMNSWDVTHCLLEAVAKKAMEWFRTPTVQMGNEHAPVSSLETKPSSHIQQAVMEILVSFQKLLGCLNMDSLLIPLVIYVERFIEALGILPDTMIFDLFLARYGFKGS